MKSYSENHIYIHYSKARKKILEIQAEKEIERECLL
jgi:hypothetical protein